LRVTCSTYIDLTSNALKNLDVGTDSVARAGDLIAEMYRDADALSQARVNDVQEVISYTPPQHQQYGPYPPAGDLR
jgi:hypothetical protein